MGYRNYSVANGFIVDPAGNGDFKTLATALTAATSVGGSGTIFIRPGTYTENPGLVAGWNLTGFTDDGLTPTVTINGTCSFSAAGTVSITGIRLQTNGATNLLSVTGSNSSIVNLNNCYLNCSANTGINFASSVSTSQINLRDCNGNLGTTGIGLYSSSSAGTVNIFESNFSNTGGSSSANSSTAGVVNLSYSSFFNPFSYTTSSGSLLEIQINTGTQNVACVTTVTSGTVNISYSGLTSGTASAVSIGAGTTVNIDYNSINCTNTNAITGAGTLNLATQAFTTSGVGINATTVTPLQARYGILRSVNQPCFQVYVNANIVGVTGAGTAYPILFDTTKFDQNSNITLNSGGKTIFTAPVTGKYLLNFTLAMNSLTVAMTTSAIQIITTGQTFFIYGGNAGVTKDSNNTVGWQLSQIVTMTAGDTAFCSVTIFNGASNAATVQGNNTGFATLFSGHLVA